MQTYVLDRNDDAVPAIQVINWVKLLLQMRKSDAGLKKVKQSKHDNKFTKVNHKPTSKA